MLCLSNIPEVIINTSFEWSQYNEVRGCSPRFLKQKTKVSQVTDIKMCSYVFVKDIPWIK